MNCMQQILLWVSNARFLLKKALVAGRKTMVFCVFCSIQLNMVQTFFPLDITGKFCLEEWMANEEFCFRSKWVFRRLDLYYSRLFGTSSMNVNQRKKWKFTWDWISAIEETKMKNWGMETNEEWNGKMRNANEECIVCKNFGSKNEEIRDVKNSWLLFFFSFFFCPYEKLV